MAQLKFNTRLSGWMEQGGAGLMITMGHKDKKHALNGPKLKAMMRTVASCSLLASSGQHGGIVPMTVIITVDS